MAKENNPCYNCTERCIGCHSKCEKYQSWSAAHIAQQQKIRSEQEKDNLYRSYIAETSARNNKRREHGRPKK